MNQKNHFVSTYQKDYTWPHAPDICQIKPPITVKICACTDSSRVLKELLDTSLEKDFDRTQTLLEPKVYSKTRPVFQTNAIQLDRTFNICAKKLEKEYPNLHELLEKISSDERIAETDVDRFKSTYQAHYSDPAAARMTQRDLAKTIIHTNDQQLRCHMPIKITIETDCPPHYHPSSSRINANIKHDLKQKNGSKREKKYGIVNGRQTLPSWKSEYQDSISKIGHAIMRIKLHQEKKKPLQY